MLGTVWPAMIREGRRRARTLRPRTVRSQVTWTAAGLVAVVLVLSAFGLVAAQQRVLTHGIDEALIQRADNIQRDVVRGTFGTRLPNEGGDPEDSFLQLLDADGSVVAVTDNATGLSAAARPLRPGANQVVATVSGVPLSNGDFRVLARSLGGTASGPGVVPHGSWLARRYPAPRTVSRSCRPNGSSTLRRRRRM